MSIRIKPKEDPKALKPADLAFIFPSAIFSLIVFILLQVVITDFVEDYLDSVITDNRFSILNYIVFFYTLALWVAFFASMALANLDKDLMLYSTLLSFLCSVVLMSIISYISVRLAYPGFFDTVNVIDQVLNFFLWNTYFIVYVLNGNTALYFVLLYVVFLSFSLLFMKWIKIKKVN